VGRLWDYFQGGGEGREGGGIKDCPFKRSRVNTLPRTISKNKKIQERVDSYAELLLEDGGSEWSLRLQTDSLLFENPRVRTEKEKKLIWRTSRRERGNRSFAHLFCAFPRLFWALRIPSGFSSRTEPALSLLGDGPHLTQKKPHTCLLKLLTSAICVQTRLQY